MNIKALKERVKPLEQFSTSSGDQWGDNIDSQKLTNAKIAHKLDSQEYVFFLSDHTFWGSANNSVMATRWGLSVKYSDELKAFSIAWKEIDYIVLLPVCGFRFGSGGKQYNFNMFQNGVKDEYRELFEELALEDMSSYKADELSVDETIEKAILGEISVENITKAIEICDRLIAPSLTSLEEQYNDLDKCEIERVDYQGILSKRAALLKLLGKTIQAKKELLGFIELCLKPDGGGYYTYYTYFKACMMLAELYEEDKELDEAMVFLNLAASMKSPDYQRNAKDKLKIVSAQKTAYMLGAPRENREMILCVDEIPVWPVNIFRFIDVSTLRNLKWKFEIGHPQTGEMYICHPLRPDHYYEVRSFHDRLFDEKRSELVHLLECIGARRLHVEAMTGLSIENQNKGNVSGKLSAESLAGASVDFKEETQGASKHEKGQVGIEDRELNPAKHPYIPNDLIWYPHEPSWQRIAQAALANRYKTLSVELRYYEDFAVNQKRMTQINGALKSFKQQIEIGWNEESEETLKQKKATVWKYTATFGGDTVDVPNVQVSSLLESETEYVDDLKAAFSDGAPAESSRKILERQRKKLGISVERAIQLEQDICNSNLSDDEKEYLQDVEDCLEDDVITDAERRMLARRREKFGISEGRALELENIVTTKKQGGHSE